MQFNSGGGALTATRSGVGQYRVRIPNQPGGGGHVQVSTYGFAAARCKVAGWTPGSGILVGCYTLGGGAADSKFTVSFVR